jgi:hypothetical protein
MDAMAVLMARLNEGTLRATKTGRVFRRPADGLGWIELKPYTSARGYRIVKLRLRGHRRGAPVHKIVWLFFKGPLPEGFELDHRNRDKQCNRLRNLRLLARRFNRARHYYDDDREVAALSAEDFFAALAEPF